MWTQGLIYRGNISNNTHLEKIYRRRSWQMCVGCWGHWGYSIKLYYAVFFLPKNLCNAATIQYSPLKFEHMHLCGSDYKYFSKHCFKYDSFGCTAAIRLGSACHGPHIDSVYSGSKHNQFNSLRLVKREAGFPNPLRALIGSNQLWHIDNSPYYRE